MKFGFFSAIISLFLVATACKQKVSGEELEIYIQDTHNGLVHIQDVQDIHITASYLPVDLLVFRDFSPEHPATAIAFQEASSAYNAVQYFTLTFSVKGHEVLDPAVGLNKYGALLRTLSFGMQQYVSITTADGDTLRPLTYSLDRTYAMSSATQLLLAFPLRPKAEWLQVNVREFGLGCGNLAFRFRQSDIQKIPKISFQ
ncbi:hypothetical protein [Hymenobacter elongatus]|uniref:Lipoprotein n=1 Tax=Hymenobacter elongatus TaxID=877208 RepID=A0A4Z0PP12_9BACT|nr:hypothetical protein [Hymenobacter elongatus]TGE19001.1 hypothetical protein E5J99_04455 [Hymenobacter elongatus]